MHDEQKSDGSVVPTKSSNDGARAPEETVEGRDPAKENTREQNATRAQNRTLAQRALDRVREAAMKDKKVKFTSLLHHVTVARLREAFLSLKRRAAPGVDGVTWNEYAVDLEAHLRDLCARVHCGAYRAKPSRRVYIPKSDGHKRPLGVASLEDKLVQKAVAEVLGAIYETDFLGFSYGFRPRRGQHDALDALATGILRKKVNWVLDADIRGFFDTIDHGWLVKFLEHRVADKRVVRLVQKWLVAGVLEEGKRLETDVGTPQGATISPLLANVFLHYVIDLWAEQWRRRHACGDVILVRYADDFVLGFQHEEDARRFRTALEERLRRFGLSLHEEKTRLLRFGRYARERCEERGLAKPATFDFLGFTHVCGTSREGKFVLLRHTVKKRMRVTLHTIRLALLRRRHLPVDEQGRWLAAVVRGYFAYFAVPTNGRRISSFRFEVTRSWLRALRRRGQRDRTAWDRMAKLAARWIPLPRIAHPYPHDRFDARIQGRSRVR
jgi:group II intron reverse transcriptase/maturase